MSIALLFVSSCTRDEHMADPKRNHLSTPEFTSSLRDWTRRRLDWHILLINRSPVDYRVLFSLVDGNQNEDKYVCRVTSWQVLTNESICFCVYTVIITCANSPFLIRRVWRFHASSPLCAQLNEQYTQTQACLCISQQREQKLISDFSLGTISPFDAIQLIFWAVSWQRGKEPNEMNFQSD